jgi:hypothetical protein
VQLTDVNYLLINLHLFQSSPARGGGCNGTISNPRRVSIFSRFNPHPPVGAGATRSRCSACLDTPSFNPHPPVGAGATCDCGSAGSRVCCFNPHPPVGAGATVAVRLGSSGCRSFNPHPPMGAGATLEHRARNINPLAVSILTRPWGRVQHAVGTARRATLARFNPHPPVGAGATLRVLCNTDPCRYELVSILTRPWGRVQRLVGGRRRVVDVEVSILTRPWGRVQRGLENARERFPKRKCSSCQGVPCRALGG